MARVTVPDGTPYHGASWIYRGLRNAIYLRDRLRCVHCEADARRVVRRGGFTLDHVRAVSTHGIDHSPANLVTSCRRCNVARLAHTVRQFSGPEGAARVRLALRRAVPPAVEGLRLHERVQLVGPAARIAEAHRRGWLD